MKHGFDLRPRQNLDEGVGKGAWGGNFNSVPGGAEFVKL